MDNTNAENTNTTGSVAITTNHESLNDSLFFVSIPNDNRVIEKFALEKDNSFNENVKIVSMKNIIQVNKEGKLKLDLNYIYKKIEAIQLADKTIKDNEALDRVMEEHTILINPINTRYDLNSPDEFEKTKLVWDHESNSYFRVICNDVFHKYTYRAKEYPFLSEMLVRGENLKYLFYDLNEFRHNRPTAIKILCGDGGSGKSIWADYFSGYKKYGHCVGFFRGDNNTGEFGNTNLIIEEEGDKEKASALTLNVIKDMTGEKRFHRLRRLYKNAKYAYGFATLLFTCNRNSHSKIMTELNRKGEDVKSVRRRISTFNFDTVLSQWLETVVDGETIGHWLGHANDLIIESNGDKWTHLDAHLNWLEETGFFNDPDFKVKKQFVVVHSKHINICTGLSNDMNVLLECIYEYFITHDKTKWEYNRDDKGETFDIIMNALQNVSKNKSVCTARVKEHFAAINNTGLFIWKRDRKGVWYCTLSDRDILVDIYNAATGATDDNIIGGLI